MASAPPTSSTSARSTAAAAGDPHAARNRLVIGVLTVSAFVVIYDRAGPRALLVVGSVLVSGALWAMATALHAGTPTFMIPIIHVVLSIGLAMTFTALFVTLLSTGAAARLAEGASAASATEAGVRLAFLVGALISVLTVAASYFVRKPQTIAGMRAPAMH